MDHSVELISSKRTDYKVCNKCGRINWYENQLCVGCGLRKFMPMSKKDVAALKKQFVEDMGITLEV